MHPELLVLIDRHGCFLRREAEQLGYDKRAFPRLVRQAELHRIRHGAYTTSDRWEPLPPAGRFQLLSRAAYRQARTAVVMSHVSSLAMLTDEWWDLPLDEVHLTRLDQRVGRREAGVRQHGGLVLPGDVQYDGEVARMTAARTGLEVATLVDFERALVVLNVLLHRRLTTKKALEAQSVDMHRWPGSLSYELLLGEADGRLESVGETRTYCAIRGSRLPRPVPQFEVFDGRGIFVARLDFAWPELGVWIEFDGKIKYQKLLREGESVTDAVLREKRREALIGRVTGWICVRVDWNDLKHPELLVARIVEAISLAARRGLRVG